MSFLCTFCGQHNVPGRPSPESVSPHCPHCVKGQSCNACGQLSDLERRIDDTTSSLRMLLEDRHKLRTEMNKRNDPIVSLLPIEVICRVFGFCVRQPPTLKDCEDLCEWRSHCYRDDKRPIQLEIGAVCHMWRKIAWGHPRLWEMLDLVLSQRTSLSFVKLVEEWIARSGQRPLVIRTIFNEHWDEGLDVKIASKVMEPIVDLLNAVAHRWRVFFARIPALSFARLQMPQNGGHILSVLGLEPMSNDEDFNFQHNGSLRLGPYATPKYVSLIGFQLRNVRLDWSNLSHFVGYCMSMTECLLLLRYSPRLQKCCIQSMRGRVVHPFDMVHSNLRSLEVDCHPLIFDFLTLPCLLALSCSLREQLRSANLVDFVNRSGCQLERLHVAGLNGQDNLINFLHATPYLKCLILEDALQEGLLEHLGETSWFVPERDDSDDSSSPFLPDLEVFTFYGCRSFPWSLIPGIAPIRHISNYNASDDAIRRPLTTIKFQLFEQLDEHQYIDQDTMRRIKKEMYGGVELVISDGSTSGDADVLAVSARICKRLASY